MPIGRHITVRPERIEDHDAIRGVNMMAFGDRAEADLVDALRACRAYIPELALVAEEGGRVVGHVLFTLASVIGRSGELTALALAPMAVLPAMQRRGIGAMLVRAGLEGAERLRHQLVIVLGHAEYYPRFGFVPASRFGIRPPFEVPDESFMAVWLPGSEPRTLDGVVRYAEPFGSVSPS